MASQEDMGRLLVRIEATQAKFEKQMAAIAKRGADSAGEIEKRFQKANDNIAKGFDRGAKAATVSIGQQKAAVANLSFQLNDIAQGLLSGVSPFTIMAQQGSQVTQALAMTGGGLGGTVRALGGAFASMLSPVSLATFAIIGLGGAAIQYFAELLTGSDTSEKKLKEQAELINKIAERWGDAVPALKQYNEQVKAAVDLADLEAGGKAAAERKSEEARSALAEISNEGQRLLQQLRLSGAVSAEAISALDAALRKTRAEMGDSGKTAENTKAVLAALSGVVSSGIPLVQQYQSKFSQLASDMAEATKRSKELESQTKSLADALRVQEQLNQFPSGVGTLSPLYSGGGKFMNEQQYQSYKFDENALREAGASAAAQMIKGFEGFITNAKWDKNHFRVGFGSDTITDAAGRVSEVTKDTVVTLADAERDLARRIVEFQSGIQQAIGVDTWNSLSEAQKAALTSIAYNYGQLPKSIVAAIQQGGGPELVAQAIAKLTSNPSRRHEEAQAYLSGTGISLKEAGLDGKSPTDVFNGDMADVQKRIDVMTAEYEALSKLNPLINDYGYAVQKAKIEQQLLSEAQKAGVDLTPELRQKISDLAEAYARATVAGGLLAEGNRKLVATMQQSSQFGKDVLGGFISDLRAGKSAAEALAGALEKVASKLLDIGLNALFDGAKAGSGGGLLGGLFTWLFADGGVAANGRPQPLKTFANGGVSKTAAIFGETGRAEAAVPLPDGRRIPVDLRAPDLRGAGGSSDTVRLVLQDDSGRMAQIADQQIRTRSGTIVQVAVQQSQKATRRAMPGMIAEAQVRSL